jgi:cytochrome P450
MTADLLSLHRPEPELPITRGNLLDFPADPIAVLRRLHAEHGDVAALEHEGSRLHFVFSPALNHQVLSDAQTFHSRFFAVRGPRNSPQRRLSSGLLSVNGDDHKRQRRMVMEAFLKKAIQGYLPTIRHLAEELLAGWRAGTEIDLAREMTEFMLRVTSTMLFGLDDPDTAYRIGRMIDDWVHLNHELGMGVFVSDPALTARYDELLTFAGKLEAEIAGMIDRRRQATDGGNNVLAMILQAHDEAGRLGHDELIGQAALIFGAAHLTTAHSLTWGLFLLAQHPSVMARVDRELRTELDGGFPTLEQLDRLVACERAIKESMRVLPASAYSQRMSAAPTQLGPFALPVGAGVIFSQFITHHRPDLFPDPEAYLPERWAHIAPSPYAYLPFGAGPRMCLGGPLAMTILKTVIPTILQRFQVTVVPQTRVDGRVISTMLCPTSGLRVRLEEPRGRFTAQPVTGNIHGLVDLREVPRTLRRAA